MTPLNNTSRIAASAASTQLPYEETSRRPRDANMRGRHPASPSKRNRRRKSAKPVLADNARTARIDAIETK